MEEVGSKESLFVIPDCPLGCSINSESSFGFEQKIAVLKMLESMPFSWTQNPTIVSSLESLLQLPNEMKHYTSRNISEEYLKGLKKENQSPRAAGKVSLSLTDGGIRKNLDLDSDLDSRLPNFFSTGAEKYTAYKIAYIFCISNTKNDLEKIKFLHELRELLKLDITGCERISDAILSLHDDPVFKTVEYTEKERRMLFSLGVQIEYQHDKKITNEEAKFLKELSDFLGLELPQSSYWEIYLQRSLIFHQNQIAHLAFTKDELHRFSILYSKLTHKFKDIKKDDEIVTFIEQTLVHIPHEEEESEENHIHINKSRLNCFWLFLSLHYTFGDEAQDDVKQFSHNTCKCEWGDDASTSKLEIQTIFLLYLDFLYLCFEKNITVPSYICEYVKEHTSRASDFNADRLMGLIGIWKNLLESRNTENKDYSLFFKGLLKSLGLHKTISSELFQKTMGDHELKKNSFFFLLMNEVKEIIENGCEDGKCAVLLDNMLQFFDSEVKLPVGLKYTVLRILALAVAGTSEHYKIRINGYSTKGVVATMNPSIASIFNKWIDKLHIEDDVLRKTFYKIALDRGVLILFNERIDYSNWG
ncbi:MAG: hypothetical protein HOE90_05125 [Bacteriovoracaceae bacterium]|jgi:hypothetical protein|nr:hypothetical protein [Bacteriovoracaceae bacterium]